MTHNAGLVARLEALAPDWLRFIRAADWGINWANPPRPEQLDDPETFIHHTAGNRRSTDPILAMQLAQESAYNRNYSTVAYDIMVHRNTDTDTIAICGGREGWRSAATLDRNEQGEAICLFGYFHPGHPLSEQPTDREIIGLSFALAWSVAHGWSASDTKTLGHRDNPAHPDNTACPGDYLYPYVPEISDFAFRLLAEAARPTPPPEDPMTRRFVRFGDRPAVYLIEPGDSLVAVHVSGTQFEALGFPTVDVLPADDAKRFAFVDTMSYGIAP